MKNLKHLAILASVSALAISCGKYEKKPVSDLEQMRENGRQEMQRPSNAPQVIKEREYVEREVKVEVPVHTIDGNSIVITMDDPAMEFVEGKASSYSVKVRALENDVQLRLVAKDLPEAEGATLQQSGKNAGDYQITWNPPPYTVQQNANRRVYDVKLIAEITNAGKSANADKLKGLKRETSVKLYVFQNQDVPTELAVAGLNGEVQEGTMTPFTITVKVPGLDAKSPKKPELKVSYDNKAITPGNEFREMDGSYYVIADPAKPEPEYIGDSKWKFSRVFDTKNVPVQPQLAKDGSFIPNADGTRVRLSFKVSRPNGPSTTEVLKQVKIVRTKQEKAP